MVRRDYYLNRIIRNMWNGEIKVITGIRRCGKSVLLFELFYEYLLQNGVQDDQIIKIELDQRKYYKFRNPLPSVSMSKGSLRLMKTKSIICSSMRFSLLPRFWILKTEILRSRFTICSTSSRRTKIWMYM